MAQGGTDLYTWFVGTVIRGITGGFDVGGSPYDLPTAGQCGPGYYLAGRPPRCVPIPGYTPPVLNDVPAASPVGPVPDLEPLQPLPGPESPPSVAPAQPISQPAPVEAVPQLPGLPAVMTYGYNLGIKAVKKLKKLKKLPIASVIYTAYTTRLEELFGRSGIGKEIAKRMPDVAKGAARAAATSVLPPLVALGGILFPSKISNSDLYGGPYDPRIRPPGGKSAPGRTPGNGSAPRPAPVVPGRAARPSTRARVAERLEPIVLPDRTTLGVFTPTVARVPGGTPAARRTSPKAPAVPRPVSRPVATKTPLLDFVVGHIPDLIAYLNAKRRDRLTAATGSPGLTALAGPISLLNPLAPPLPGTWPALEPLTAPQGRGVGSASDRCRCSKPTKRKPRAPRTVCYKGTYTESRTGLSKQRREEIPCQ